MADQANSRIAAIAMPDQKEPTEKEILNEAKRQFIETQKQTILASKQQKTLTEILITAKENGFRRAR
jgi:hypothetical protein